MKTLDHDCSLLTFLVFHALSSRELNCILYFVIVLYPHSQVSMPWSSRLLLENLVKPLWHFYTHGKENTDLLAPCGTFISMIKGRGKENTDLLALCGMFISMIKEIMVILITCGELNFLK
jgi:hypothetical protein